jgi:hypothetical protein
MNCPNCLRKLPIKCSAKQIYTCLGCARHWTAEELRLRMCDDQYLNDLRIILQQARKEQWDTLETGIAVRTLQFTLAMKYQEPKNKGILTDG